MWRIQEIHREEKVRFCHSVFDACRDFSAFDYGGLLRDFPYQCLQNPGRKGECSDERHRLECPYAANSDIGRRWLCVISGGLRDAERIAQPAYLGLNDRGIFLGAPLFIYLIYKGSKSL